MTTPAPTMRIGDLAARTGVSAHVLRVWERRYGLLTPSRSSGGYRLYGPQDEWRVREVVRLRAEGVSASQAAATALSTSRGSVPPATESSASGDAGEAVAGDGVHRLRLRLLRAIAEFDATAAHAVVDVALGHLGVEQVVGEVVLPVLHETGERWASGELTVAHEHFASNLLRSRLATLTLAWDSGTGPLAVLACPPGEQHDLGLMCFGVVLGRTGWRVRYLGADTPVVTLGSAVEVLEPDLVVLSAVSAEPLLAAAGQIERLPERSARALAAAHVVVGGAGATTEVAERLGATLLAEDVLDAARRVSDRRGPAAGQV